MFWVTEAKNNLSALIDSVKGGSPVPIVDRGRPVARLVRDGIARPARAAMPKGVLATKPPRVKKNASGVQALLEDRRDGR